MFYKFYSIHSPIVIKIGPCGPELNWNLANKYEISVWIIYEINVIQTLNQINPDSHEAQRIKKSHLCQLKNDFLDNFENAGYSCLVSFCMPSVSIYAHLYEI